MMFIEALVDVWPMFLFVGAAIWWAATMSRDVKALDRDISGIRSDLAEIKLAIVK